MRTIRKASPPMRGADVRRLQQALAVSPFARALGGGGGFAPGPIDGIAGPKTLAAIKRAKHALGYPKPDEVGDKLLLVYLERRVKITPLMRKRRDERIAAWEEAQGRRPKIVSPKWKWRGVLLPRVGPPPEIIYHHAAATSASAEQIHAGHLARGFTGIGYHYYVRKSGVVYVGRPLWAVGAHTSGHNRAIGVCCEGNYEVDKIMPAEQLGALLWLRDDLARKYPKAKRVRHRDVNATACPGRYFPWSVVK